MKDDVLINLFVLHFYYHEVQLEFFGRFKPVVFDEYMYKWNIGQVNFKIIKTLIVQ